MLISSLLSSRRKNVQQASVLGQTHGRRAGLPHCVRACSCLWVPQEEVLLLHDFELYAQTATRVVRGIREKIPGCWRKVQGACVVLLFFYTVVHVHMCVSICLSVCIHIYIHTYMHIHVHIYRQAQRRVHSPTTVGSGE